jgi:hypothetical protein
MSLIGVEVGIYFVHFVDEAETGNLVFVVWRQIFWIDFAHLLSPSKTVTPPSITRSERSTSAVSQRVLETMRLIRYSSFNMAPGS